MYLGFSRPKFTRDDEGFLFPIFPEVYHNLYDDTYTYAEYNRILKFFHIAFPRKCDVSGCDGQICKTGVQITKYIGFCSSNNVWTRCYSFFKWWAWDLNLTSQKEFTNPFLLNFDPLMKYWFRCPNNKKCGCHVFCTSILSFVKSQKCLFCEKLKVCEHCNAFTENPDLRIWWDYQRNKHPPQKFSPFSKKKCWFRCPNNQECNCHIFRVTMKEFINGRRCHLCSGRRTCEHSKSVEEKPNILTWWDYSKNDCSPLDIEIPDLISGENTDSSGISISERNTDFNGLSHISLRDSPDSISLKDSPESSISLRDSPDSISLKDSPDSISLRDSPDSNGISNVSNPRQKGYWFKCPKGHSFRSSIKVFSYGCRYEKCSFNKYLKLSIVWFNHIIDSDIYTNEQSQKCYIRHAGNEGEIKIKGIGKIDGYIPSHDIYLEFHGCYWHGCPQCYPDRQKKNNIANDTFEMLYLRTLEKSRRIREMGYNLIEMWECDFREILRKQLFMEIKQIHQSQKIVSTD